MEAGQRMFQVGVLRLELPQAENLYSVILCVGSSSEVPRVRLAKHRGSVLVSNLQSRVLMNGRMFHKRLLFVHIDVLFVSSVECF